MRNDQERPRAPDYTTAALIMLGVNLMWIFLVIWAYAGFLPVLILAVFLNRAITRLEARLA
jgi:hypothetical protein